MVTLGTYSQGATHWGNIPQTQVGVCFEFTTLRFAVQYSNHYTIRAPHWVYKNKLSLMIVKTTFYYKQNTRRTQSFSDIYFNNQLLIA